jgi:hypothetical protein
LGPPGLSGCLRGCGSVDACCEGVAEEAGGVGNPGPVVDVIALAVSCDFGVSRVVVSCGGHGQGERVWTLSRRDEAEELSGE